VLVYSTCTLNDRENGDIVARFLSEHGDFVPDPLALPEGIERLIDEPAHCLTLFPGVYHTDGFFIARMRKAEKR
jgi:16S rRNA (cytosine967-C5)-methyltransferase